MTCSTTLGARQQHGAPSSNARLPRESRHTTTSRTRTCCSGNDKLNTAGGQPKKKMQRSDVPKVISVGLGRPGAQVDRKRQLCRRTRRSTTPLHPTRVYQPAARGHSTDCPIPTVQPRQSEARSARPPRGTLVSWPPAIPGRTSSDVAAHTPRRSLPPLHEPRHRHGPLALPPSSTDAPTSPTPPTQSTGPTQTRRYPPVPPQQRAWNGRCRSPHAGTPFGLPLRGAVAGA